MDGARVGDGMTREDLERALREFREHVDSGFESVDRKFESMDQKLDSLDARMRIGFEETHRLVKMGFESVQILDEKIDRRFNETERQHADHRTLLEAAIRDLGRDLPLRSTPVPRRRRRSRD